MEDVLLVILCIGVLAGLITFSYCKKKIEDEAYCKESLPPIIEHNVKVLNKEIGYKPSVGTVCSIKFLLTSGKEIELTTSSTIYNNINKSAVGTLKYLDDRIVSFMEN